MPWFHSWVGKIRWRRDRVPTPVFLGFPCGSAGKECACNKGDLGSIPRLGRSSGEGKEYPLQYCTLENSMDNPWGHKQLDTIEWLSLKGSQEGKISNSSPYVSTTSAAAAAAKSLQSCPTLCYPIDSSPPGSPVPGILQARTLEWVAISFANAWKWKVKVKSLSRVLLLVTPWTAADQAPPSMGFSRQEYWSGCHCLLWAQHLDRCNSPPNVEGAFGPPNWAGWCSADTLYRLIHTRTPQCQEFMSVVIHQTPFLHISDPSYQYLLFVLVKSA